jgi:hypothetical protein
MLIGQGRASSAGDDAGLKHSLDNHRVVQGAERAASTNLAGQVAR